MTPYESLLWNSWLPRVRSSLNNDWSPEDPLPAVRLYEAWSAFLPPFIRDNFFDQLVLPKVHKAVGDWNPRKSKVPLQTLVFPWLPHVGLRLEEVLGDARRKVKSVLRAWTTSDAIPQDLGVWKDVSIPSLVQHRACILTDAIRRFSTSGIGIRCFSSTSCPSLALDYGKISASILGNKTCNLCKMSCHGSSSYARPSFHRSWRRSSSQSGWTCCTSGSSSPTRASRRYRDGTRSGRVHFRRTCRACQPSHKGLRADCS